MFYIKQSAVDTEWCRQLAERIEKHWLTSKAQGLDPNGFDQGARTMDITQDPIARWVQSVLEADLRVKLTLDQAELQCWPTTAPGSPLHRHNWNGREHGDYNSLLYLNQDFTGGQFYTDGGLMLKPTTGTLTFFLGRDQLHGVRPVSGKNRYTAIFWWRDTRPEPC
jgi:2OG-Fe(II) oxygenase superfamily